MMKITIQPFIASYRHKIAGSSAVGREPRTALALQRRLMPTMRLGMALGWVLTLGVADSSPIQHH